MLKKSKFSRRSKSFEEDVNPMHYVSNLSDAMLVLAVGIMVALVTAWNVDISTGEYTSSSTPTAVEIEEDVESLETSSEKTEDSMTVEDFGLTEYGRVYVDENGNYYVVED